LNKDISGGAWCPAKTLSAATSGEEWIQVDLRDLFVITSVATQGRFGNGVGVEFTEEFWLEYSRDNGTTWFKWTDQEGNHVCLAIIITSIYLFYSSVSVCFHYLKIECNKFFFSLNKKYCSS
jgi:discoidin domain receptor family protein 2